VEDHESLKTSTLVSKLSYTVKDQVNNLLTNGVVTTGVVIGSILLSRDHLLGVIKLTVSTSTDLVTDTRLQIDEHSTGYVFTGTSLREKGVEGIVTATNGLVGRHLTIGLNTVLKAQQLPGGVTALDTSLSKMNSDTLSHDS
jgi:hypothetical protein